MFSGGRYMYVTTFCFVLFEVSGMTAIFTSSRILLKVEYRCFQDKKKQDYLPLQAQNK